MEVQLKNLEFAVPDQQQSEVASLRETGPRWVGSERPAFPAAIAFRPLVGLAH